jgi:hypothetical protein
MTALYGITVWCLIAPLLIFLLYVSTRPLIQGMADQIQRRRHAPL